MNNKIFRYFDNQMSDAERSQFESDLSDSPEMQNELHDLRLTSEKIQNFRVQPEMNDYFIAARYKAINSRKELSFFIHGWQYAFQTMVAAVFVVVTYIGFTVSGSGYFQNPLGELIPATSEEYSDFIQSSVPEQTDADMLIQDDSVSGEVVNSAISNELNIDRKTSPALAEDMNISTDDLLDNLSSGELDQLYASLDEAPTHKD